MKPILNYFVPFTNGKFVASCLMFSNDVNGTPNQLLHDHWTKNEYSDVDFWWTDHFHNWFNTDNWRDYLNPEIDHSKYSFYTCHEDYAVHHVKRLIPESRIITVIPDLELCRANYNNKNWIESESDFETSRVFTEFQAFSPITSDIVINQTDLFSRKSFTETIERLRESLNINLDMDKVLAYRNYYFSHPSNQI